MTTTNVRCFVLAGGTGKRFWPLSREMSPKQLLRIFGTESLVVDAVHRLSEIPGARPESISILTNERLADELKNTLACSDQEWVRTVSVLVEPLGRDSGAALALCAATAALDGPETIVAVLPSNQVMSDTHEWSRLVAESLKCAERGRIATLGFPDVPELTSDVIFGRADVLMDAINGHSEGEAAVAAAIEVAAMPLSTWTDEATRDTFSVVRPFPISEVLAASRRLVDTVYASSSARQIADFTALADLTEPDPSGNHRIGRGVDIDSSGCIVHSTDRLVCTLGISDAIVVDTADATLVCDATQAGRVREVSDLLARHGEPEATTPKTSLRPWGSWSSLWKAPGYQMKLIVVDEGRRVSLQSHEHRSEHWVVVEGVADVTLDDDVVRVPAGQSIYIPAGVVHRMTNVGEVPLKIIEVQVGGYLGEDDIVRYEDDYNRAP